MYSNNKQITLPSGGVPAIHTEITKQTNKQTKCIAIINKLLFLQAAYLQYTDK